MEEDNWAEVKGCTVQRSGLDPPIGLCESLLELGMVAAIKHYFNTLYYFILSVF